VSASVLSLHPHHSPQSLTSPAHGWGEGSGAHRQTLPRPPHSPICTLSRPTHTLTLSTRVPRGEKAPASLFTSQALLRIAKSPCPDSLPSLRSFLAVHRHAINCQWSCMHHIFRPLTPAYTSIDLHLVYYASTILHYLQPVSSASRP